MSMSTYHVRVGDGRRIVLHPEVCRSLGLEVGDTAVLHVEDHQATLRSVDQTVAHFRALLAERIPRDQSLVDELIADREHEATRE